MESVNYTYEEEIGYWDWTEYKIIDKSGYIIAITDYEEDAELIVAALNGVAP